MVPNIRDTETEALRHFPDASPFCGDRPVAILFGPQLYDGFKIDVGGRVSPR